MALAHDPSPMTLDPIEKGILKLIAIALAGLLLGRRIKP